jgi:hypothetical protein
MIGLAKMCWVVAIYRLTPLTWDRALDASNTWDPVSREEVAENPEGSDISAEYYRLIDGFERVARIPTLEEAP